MAPRTKSADNSKQMLTDLKGLFFETLWQKVSRIQNDEPPCPKNDRVLDFLVSIGGECPFLAYSRISSAPNSKAAARLIEAGSIFQGLGPADLEQAYERLADEGYDRFADEIHNRLAENYANG